MCFLDILVVFELDLGQISFDLVENAFCNMTTYQSCYKHRVLGHFDPGMHRNQNFDEKVTYVFTLIDFWNVYFAFPFSPFLFFSFCRSD